MKKMMLGIAAGMVTAAVAWAHCGSCGVGEAHSDEGADAPKAAKADIVDTAVAAGSFKTLATALTEAGLVETLKGEGPFTVFAPTDAAFAALPAGTVEALLKDKEKLTAILTYHVVPGKLMAADVVGKPTLKTAQGETIKITSRDGTVKVNNAKILKTDVLAKNGVIHVIDTVILPPAAS